MSAGWYRSLGLRSNGTVVATGKNSNGECKVSSWKNIIQISAGYDYSLGLCSDGKVMVAGRCSFNEKISRWKDIVQVSSGYDFALGLRSDGTVVYAGKEAACDVSEWTDIYVPQARIEYLDMLKKAIKRQSFFHL